MWSVFNVLLAFLIITNFSDFALNPQILEIMKKSCRAILVGSTKGAAAKACKDIAMSSGRLLPLAPVAGPLSNSYSRCSRHVNY